ncbi:hypothetical protein INT47_011615 [Mucor saturninus]|uniref:Alcohol acetyltransferase n=1 Tax=Mucor saturninus TaxID=64648 RepID=A0A8H7R5C5_9FUNG|nr:hypothetical protein INT47_011615 [Mucor saturninus]
MSTRQERPLGLLEKYQTSKQLTHAYGNITMTALLDHESIVSQPAETFYMQCFVPALTRLIHHHAALSMVVRDKTENSIHFEQLTSIDLDKVICIRSPLSLSLLIKEQTTTEFDLDSFLPLWRITIVPQTPTSCIVSLAMHHVLGDGMSLCIVWQALLQALQTIETKPTVDKVTIVKKMHLPLPYELSNAPEMSLLWDVVPVICKSLIPKILPTSIARRLDPLSSEGWQGDFKAAVDGETHDTQIGTIHVPLDIWKPLVEASKKRGISPHAILFVTMLLAWKRLYPGQTTETTTPINCRGLCQPAVSADRVGNFVGSYTGVWTGQQLDESEKDIWKMATRYHQDLQTNKKEAAKQALFLKYLPEFPASYCDFWYDKRKNSRLGRTGGLELSDLGRFHDPEATSSSWKLKQLYFAQSAQIFTCAFGLNTISVRDELYCTYGWQKGALDEAKIGLYHDIFIGILKNVPF